MKIFTINNKEEEKFLRSKAADFDFSAHSKNEINELVKQIQEIMKQAIGVGLSANQIGLDMNVFVAEVPMSDKTLKFFSIFNSKITKKSKETSILEEGCLSVPGIYGLVERPARITLVGWDENDKKIKIKASGILARVFQHEFDHLNGILFIDKAKDIHKII